METQFEIGRDSVPKQKTGISGREAAYLVRLLALARARDLPLLPAVATTGELEGMPTAQPFLVQPGLREENLVDRLRDALAVGTDAPAAEMLRTLQRVGLPAEGLHRLADWLCARADYRHHLFRAVSYPLSLVITVALVYLPVLHGLLLPLVLGRFKDLFLDLGIGQRLPPLTRSTLAFYDLFAADWSRPLPCLLWMAAVLGLCWACWRFGTRLTSSRLALLLPVTGAYLRYDAALSFCEYLALQLPYSVPLHEAVRRAGTTIANRALRAKLLGLASQLEDGVSLDHLLGRTALFPRTITFRLAAAIRRSSLLEELPSLAAECRGHLQLLELRITRSARNLSSAIALIVLVPVLVVVAAVYAPLFTLVSTIG